MLKISLIGSVAENDQSWAVYNIHDSETFEVIYVGHCKLTDVLKTPDVRGIIQFDINKKIIIDVQSIHNKMLDAKNEASKLIEKHNRPVLNRVSAMTKHCPIECVETGQRWTNAAECARQQGINVGNLSNHLNNRPSFNKIHGLTYRRVQLVTERQKVQENGLDDLPWVAAVDHYGKITVWQGISNSKNVIAAGERKKVLTIAHKWLLDNSTIESANLFAADHGIY